MDALEKHYDPRMGYYFSCPHCQQKYVSAECVREHSPNCHMQSSSSSFMMPKIESYSSLNPQAVDQNFDSEGFRIRHEIIKTEPEGHYTQDDHNDWQDETEDSSLIDPEEIIHKVPNHRQPELQKTGPKLLRDSNVNPHSTCKEDRYVCRFCPRTFPYPSVTRQHEESHGREPKYSCRTCGERFRWPSALTNHMKIHEPAKIFTCSYPGCVKTFKSYVGRWYHHKCHAKGGWNEPGTRPRILRKNQPPKVAPTTTIIMPESEHLFVDNQEVTETYPVTHLTEHKDFNIGVSSMTEHGNGSIGESSMTEYGDWNIGESSMTAPNNKSPENAMATGLPYHLIPKETAQLIPCCYPGCPETFKHKTARWIHHKSHPKGRWNASGRRPGWNLRLKQTYKVTPRLIPKSQNLFIDRQSTNQQAAGSNIPPPTRRRGRKAYPGNEIEIMTAFGRRFKCDLCDKTFTTRPVVRYHRLGHFDTPQVPCYMTGCSEMFFSRVQRIEHLKLVHHVKFRKGKPFIGSKQVVFRKAGHGKVIAKEINSNFNTPRQPSQCPQKIQLDQSPNFDPNIPAGSQIGRVTPGQPFLFTCGICNDNFENFNALQTHVRTHSRTNEPQADDDLEIIDTPVLNSFGSVEFSCQGDQISVEVKENQASYLPQNFNGTQQVKESGANRKQFKRGYRAPRYPTVTVGGKKYYYCGFPGCDAVFNTRIPRYMHQKKFHNDAPRSIFTYLPDHALSGHQPNVSQVSRQDEESLGAHMPEEVLVPGLDQDSEADEPDISEFLHQSMDPLELNTDDNLMQRNLDLSLLNQYFPVQNIVQTDGRPVSLLSTEASTFNLNPAGVSISNPASIKENVVADRPPLKDKKGCRMGRPARYPTLQVGSTQLFPCAFAGCKGVFNSRTVRYSHHKRHRMGYKNINSKLKLTEDGVVWDSAEGCYLIE